ncbi:MAG TPA: hypothetical protein VIV60_15310 [Polyangiaceae bacterium]
MDTARLDDSEQHLYAACHTQELREHRRPEIGGSNREQRREYFVGPLIAVLLGMKRWIDLGWVIASVSACGAPGPQHEAHTLELLSDCCSDSVESARFFFPSTTFKHQYSQDWGPETGTDSGNTGTGVAGTLVAGDASWVKSIVMHGFEHLDHLYYVTSFGPGCWGNYVPQDCLVSQIGRQTDCTSRMASDDSDRPVPVPGHEECWARLDNVEP